MSQLVIDHNFSFGENSQHSQGQQIISCPTNKASLKILLLHGNLEICVMQAKNLPNMDMFHKTLGDVFSKFPTRVSNKLEGHMITSDPYVTISVAGAVVGRTFVIGNSENPVWMQHFNVPVAHFAAEVHFVVKDSDFVGSQIIGVVGVSVEQLCLSSRIEGTFPLLGTNGKPIKGSGGHNPALTLSIRYTPLEQVGIYRHGLGSGPDYNGVPGTYFPVRKGGKAVLYQDAHVHDDVPNIRLDGHVNYEQRSCWLDICNAISEARRLIYITGWSVSHKVRLVRGGNDGQDCTLGDLLKTKSQEGVRVLLLVWDDPTSKSFFGYKSEGVMHTSDEETRHFFKHSSVQVLLCPRSAGKGPSFIRKQEAGTIYTHHQKTVIVDADAGQYRRKIIAFLGGLDLCAGRYDTPQHPLFSTLKTVHKDDYRNPTFAERNPGCPRQPWHDLHCQIEGEAAYDVLTNFEERWLKASKPHGFRKLKTSSDDSLLRFERIPEIVGREELASVIKNDPEDWHIQVFRSIDSNSVKGFPSDPKDAISRNLVCGKNVLIDMSIHTAYVNAIRSAQHYIYIENQYFLGSSYNWESNKDIGANNLIPMEIALKIARKIRANERFAAYILVPMWPEGSPTSVPIQRILYWQQKTMKMMYEIVYKALVEVGLEKIYEPQDYLNFYCLGNREAPDYHVDVKSSTLAKTSSTLAKTPQALSERNRRFMIYIHSKAMIIDDEYVIIGSANINQRSMEGTRDTEIAMGAYQPHHTLARKHSGPRGQVYGYRMSLWAEHLGAIEECFAEPESLECVGRVRYLGEQNWRQFVADEVTKMEGHLLKYPVEVDRTGKIKSLSGFEAFPDVGGNVLGSFTAIQENLTI